MDLKGYETESVTPIVPTSLRKILEMTAETSEEKFKVLDARDKLYKILKDKDPSLKRSALVATCPDMCPEKERLLREYQGRGSIFEMTNYSKSSSFNHCLAVKEYARSSADQEEPLPHDLRPIQVLTMTMSHLLHNVVDYCELTDDNLEEWYMFMWDRTRALRKELTQQGVCNLESVTLVEQCARFHIHCAERLVDQDSSIYDDKINTENLTKCLQTLKYMYKDLAKEDVKCPNEPEFICYSLLLNLNNSSVFIELSNMSSSLMSSEPVKFALDIMTAWETRNYIRFFNLIKKTTYLNCCLLRRYFGEMRLYAIKTMIRSYCTKTYSPQIVLSRFVVNLNFEGEQDCLNFLSQCNFNFHKVNEKTVVNFDRILFQNPKTALTSGRAYLYIEEKKARPLSVVIAGGELPPKLFKNYVPQNSFTEDGSLNLNLLPQTDLFDFSSASSKSGAFDSRESDKTAPQTIDAYQEDEENYSVRDPRLQKRTEETTTVSQSSLFSMKKENESHFNIFSSNQASVFGGVSEGSNIFNRNLPPPGNNIFNSAAPNQFVTNIFGKQNSSTTLGESKNIFQSETKSFPLFRFSSTNEQSDKKPLTMFPPANAMESKSNNFIPSFQFKSNIEDMKSIQSEENEEKLKKERLERERLEKEKEEEDRKKREEEDKKIQEENQKKEIERKEREKLEAEERLKKEELARLKREERNRQEEIARQERLREANARHLAELKKQEENKRKMELEHKRKVDCKMSDLKKKIQKWKTKIIFDKWRMKTWSSIEEQKMNEYFKEVKLKYPPVCTEEVLDGNPYGLLIPSVLTFEKFQNWRNELNQVVSKKLLIINKDLPLIKVDSLLGKCLEDRAKKLDSKVDPYQWKLVISVPDELESPEYWKSIETFVEMHFVQHFQWQFGVQKGPLYFGNSSRGSFRYSISVRRLRGCKLFEGSEPNPSATTGDNALVFFLVEGGNDITRQRLKAVLTSRPPLPMVPVIIISLNDRSEQENLTNTLGLQSFQKSHISYCHIVSVSNDDHLVTKFIKSLHLAVAHSSLPSSLRISPLTDFLVTTCFSSLWRRIEISLSNFKINLQEPKVLIEFYNSCIEELIEIFFDKSYDKQTTLGGEYSEFVAHRPALTAHYKTKLESIINRLKLPHWPLETPKSCHQLNYRIHQYCKKIVAQDKVKMKNLKWMLYSIIRRFLLWKGLDIYCNEDINAILNNFPWIQVFQEITGFLTRQLNEDVAKGFLIIYNLEKIENFAFESSFIGQFLKKLTRRSANKNLQSFGEDEMEVSKPRLENDSIVYAYSVALERESNKRKRMEEEKEEECIDGDLDSLFSSSAGKRIVLEEEEAKNFNLSEIERNFQTLNGRLDEIKKLMMENSKVLTDFQNEIQ